MNDKDLIEFKKISIAEDLEVLTEIRNNQDAGIFLRANYTEELTQDNTREWVQLFDDKKKLLRGIYLDDELVGYLGFNLIQKTDRSATIFIAIGDKAHRGKGIGTLGCKWLLEYGFTKLDLNRIELTCLANNFPAIHVYEKLGFKHEGVKRQAAYRNGEFIDKLLMSMLKSEYYTPPVNLC